MFRLLFPFLSHSGLPSHPVEAGFFLTPPGLLESTTPPRPPFLLVDLSVLLKTLFSTLSLFVVLDRQGRRLSSPPSPWLPPPRKYS